MLGIIYLIFTFLYCLSNLVIVRLIFNKKYIKNVRICKGILIALFLFFVSMFVITLYVDMSRYIKINYLDWYFGVDKFIVLMRSSVFILFAISVIVYLSNILCKIIFKNDKYYKVCVIVLFIIIFMSLYITRIIGFGKIERSWFGLYELFQIVKRGIFIILFVLSIVFAYRIDNKIENIKLNDDKKHYIVIAMMIIFCIVMNVLAMRHVFEVYPTYLYIKSMTKRINSESKTYVISEVETKENEYKVNRINFSKINVGDTIECGYKWIVIDKDIVNKRLLLYSKHGVNVIQNKAIETKVDDYKWFNNSSDYEVDRDNIDELNYINSALRYECHKAFDYYLNYILKDENNFKRGILNTYLKDTNTNEYFFPLSESEYNKYKMIEGVGNFYFVNNRLYTIYGNQFDKLIYTLRTFKKTKGNEYDFRCVNTGYSSQDFDWDEGNGNKIKDYNIEISKPFWFSEAFPYDYYEHELYNGFIDVVLRPAMWYQCE